MFPDGEDFFVRSVRHYRDEITDPELKRQVAGFIGQEAMHGREHRALNDRLDELGYPTKRFERITKKGLELRCEVRAAEGRTWPPPPPSSTSPPRSPSSCSRARRPASSSATTRCRNLFLWHALEESEHKAVAFDVYKAVGGSERMRVWTMKFLRYGFVAGMAVQVRRLAGHGQARPTSRGDAPQEPASGSASRRSCRRELWQQLKDYNRPDFHPDDRDTDELVEQWRAELFGDEGTLNDKLASAAAAVA